MMELMSSEALATGAARRREVALDTMRDIKTTDGVRHGTVLAIVAIGQRLSRTDIRGAAAKADPKLQPCVDCR